MVERPDEITIHVVCPGHQGRTLELHLSPTEDTLETLKVLISSETGVDVENTAVWAGMRPLRAPAGMPDTAASIASLGLRDGDTLTLFVTAPSAVSTRPPPAQRARSAAAPLPSPQPPAVGIDQVRQALSAAAATAGLRDGDEAEDDTAVDPEEFLNYLQADADLLQQLLRNNPVLAEAAMSGDKAWLREVLMAQQDERLQARRRAREELRALERRVEETLSTPRHNACSKSASASQMYRATLSTR